MLFINTMMPKVTLCHCHLTSLNIYSGNLSIVPTKDHLRGFAQCKVPNNNYAWQNKCSITGYNYYSTNSHINNALMTPELPSSPGDPIRPHGNFKEE